MIIAELVREREFKEVSQVKLDGKKRVILSAAGESGKLYKVYRNEAGQIFLDPMAVIPESELWLFKNTVAMKSVQRGLRQSGEGKTKELGSMAKYADDEIE